MDKSENISIIISDVSKQYFRQKGIHNITTNFESGKLNIIIGENGSGKSTLLKCIMGLVEYKGKIDKQKYRIGYAPEEFVMPLSMNVIEFLHSIGRIKGVQEEELNERTIYYLQYFDLLEYKHKKIGSLSNGMRQKINLLQAFIHNPKILILDEPLAALDQDSIPKVIKLIKERAKISLVVVSTHQLHKFRFKNRKLYRFFEGRLINDNVDEVIL